MSAVDELARATHQAMIARPPHVALFHAVRAAEDGFAAAALLRDADPEVREAAMQYAAEPEGDRERSRRLAWLRADPLRIAALQRYYREHLADWIEDWCTIVDPRRTARGQSAVMPFVLFPKQRELVAWLVARWRTGTAGTVVKARDVGASSVCLAAIAGLCIFEDHFSAGVISSTESKLDRYADTLFMKLRALLRDVPREFNGGYDPQRTDNYLAIGFPDTRGSITGGTGAQAFRGSRLSLVLVDEAAHLMDSAAIDAALTSVSDVRIDVSTPAGMGGAFYARAHNPAIARFDIDWRSDPRRDEAWYAKQVETLDPVVLAQEVLADFGASRQGTVLPMAWIQSSIGLADRLGLTPSGAKYAALDIGDTSDRCALAVRHGAHLVHLESWSGAGSDLGRSVARAFRLCDEWDCRELVYDASGIGAGARGFARELNEQRAANRQPQIRLIEFLGASAPEHPKRTVPRTGRTWEDLCANRKAQAWWHLRQLVEGSHRADAGENYDADSIFCMGPGLPERTQAVQEMAQPTMSENSAGKLLIDKLGDGERSPDRADAIAMVFAPRRLPMRISDGVLENAQRSEGARRPMRISGDALHGDGDSNGDGMGGYMVTGRGYSPRG